jgi:hypothetical protein
MVLKILGILQKGNDKTLAETFRQNYRRKVSFYQQGISHFFPGRNNEGIYTGVDLLRVGMFRGKSHGRSQ